MRLEVDIAHGVAVPHVPAVVEGVELDVLSHVPLTDQTGVITCLLQNLGERGVFGGVEAVHGVYLGIDVVESGTLLILASHQAYAGGGADGGRAEVVAYDAVVGQEVDIGAGNQVAAIGMDTGKAHVVGKDEYNVGMIGVVLCLRHAGSQGQHGKDH